MQSVTKAKPIPSGYHSLNHILISDNASGLIDFLKQAFNAEEKERFMTSDGRVQHALVRIGDSVIMLNDSTPEFPAFPGMISLYTENTDAVYNQALKAGATSLREPADQFYGDRSAGVRDPLGNSWWIATRIEDLSQEEIEKRAKAQESR